MESQITLEDAWKIIEGNSSENPENKIKYLDDEIIVKKVNWTLLHLSR